MSNIGLTNTEHLLKLARLSKQYTADNIFTLNAATIEALDELWKEVTSIQASHPNLLDNAYFIGGGSQQGDGYLPINRLSKVKYTANGACIDRFAITRAELSLQTNAIALQRNESSNSFGAEFYQRILGFPFDNFDCLTYSVIIDDKLYSVTINSSELGTSNSKIYPLDDSNFGVTIYKHDTDLTVIFRWTGLDAIFVSAMKLELGPIQTLAHFENDKWILNEIPNFAEQYSICSQYGYDATNPTIIKNQCSNSNLLDNAFFVGGGSQQGTRCFPINQRGEIEYNNPDASYRYTVDRWSLRRATLTINDDGISITNISNAESRQMVFRQKIDKNKIIKGQTYTFSFLFSEYSPETAISGIVNSTSFVKNVTEKLSYNTITIEEDLLNDLVIAINLPKNGSAKVLAAKFEMGTTQTLGYFEDGEWVLNDCPDYFLELTKCQFYQRVFYGEDGNLPIFFGYGNTNKEIVFPYPHDMAFKPANLNIDRCRIRDLASGTFVEPITSTAFYNDQGNGGYSIGVFCENVVSGGTYVLMTQSNTRLIIDANPEP